jgi:hypothetical protein
MGNHLLLGLVAHEEMKRCIFISSRDTIHSITDVSTKRGFREVKIGETDRTTWDCDQITER